MLCEQILGKLPDFDLSGKTVEYVDIEWHETFKKYIKRQPITEQRSVSAMHRYSGAKTIRLLQSTTSPCLLCCRRFTASRQ